MTNQEMNEKINQIITDFLFPLKKHENSKEELAALSLLLRGFVTCNNDSIEKRPFLLTGINPSFGSHDGKWKFFPGGYDVPFTFRDAISKSKPQDYWGKKRKQFGDNLCNIMAYSDLFPIRESEQRLFEQVFNNPKLTKLRADLLSITQDAIEAMAPRLIVHANRQSMYYWGLIDDAPWMGYKFELVNPAEYDNFPKCMNDERLHLFPFYKITGFTDDTRRINKEMYPNITHLEGCFFMEYVMGYRKKEDQEKMYKSKDWEEIWKWVQDHYAESHK